ncbi:hypothetical protein [Echinicola sediminis]
MKQVNRREHRYPKFATFMDINPSYFCFLLYRFGIPINMESII